MPAQTTKEEALQNIKSLVARFEEQKESYKNKDYNETQTRRDFIDPFWEALGWDVANKSNSAESYREVIHEDRVKVGGSTKAPDYSFRLPGGKRMFFLEAKKPSVHIKDDIESAAQVRRYGWCAGLSISILTNFDYFAVYNCTFKPKQTDTSSAGRIKQLAFCEYITEFDFIWDTFSRERVQQGGLDKYIQNDNNKKGTSTVDRDFLESLDKWRIELAKNISAHNAINEDELNFVVQNTIDRIIFLRIAEDRHVELYGQLQEAVKSGDFYKNILHIFTIADQKYNSGLFDFKKDTISEKITIDNKTIKNIISQLYPPLCPYEFSVMAVEIIGSAYEQFLGKQILLSKSGRAVIEEKPEVRKAGGVYYTPQYIVDYIVKNTVGKLIEDMSDVEVSAIKIVDPACGSGSFLLGAYQYLLNWHKDFYNLNEKQNKGKKNSPLTPAGELTTDAKKHILTNNIFGVDLDSNAVEVTKLSLLLKCMEGETKDSIEAQAKLFHDRILPDLDNNIKSGNSLIDLDYYGKELDFGEERKIKPFSWEKNFPQVFAQGGFDCVIGNPPWGAEFGKEQISYLMSKYTQLPTKTKDSYLAFVFRALNLLKLKGKLGFIIPNTWLLINYAQSFRKFILNFKIDELIDFGDGIFPDAIVESSTLILENTEDKNGKCNVKRIKRGNILIDHNVSKSIWNNDIFQRIILEKDKNTEIVLEKIKNTSVEAFETNCEIIWGIKPYQVGYGTPPQTKEMQKKRIYHSDTKLGEQWKPLLVGSHINRYFITYNNYQFINYGKNLMYSSNEEKMLAPKILMRQTSDIIRASYDDRNFYCQNSVFIITSKKLNLKYLLGLLNSRLFDFLYKLENPQKGKVFAEIKPSAIKSLPIKLIDHNNKSEVRIHNEIIKHVDQLLQLNKDLQTATLPNQKEQLQAKIGYHEEQINTLVYKLYGLTEEEIKIVEGS